MQNLYLPPANPEILLHLFVPSEVDQTLAMLSSLASLSAALQNCPPSIVYSWDPRTRISGYSTNIIHFNLLKIRNFVQPISYKFNIPHPLQIIFLWRCCILIFTWNLKYWKYFWMLNKIWNAKMLLCNSNVMRLALRSCWNPISSLIQALQISK